MVNVLSAQLKHLVIQLNKDTNVRDTSVQRMPKILNISKYRKNIKRSEASYTQIKDQSYLHYTY